MIIKAKVFGVGGKFDLDNKWDNGQFVGPATELKGGFVVRDCNGRYLTTMHMKTNVVDVDKFIKPDMVEAILPAPITRVKRKSTVAKGYDGDTPLPTRDSERGSPLLGPTGEFVVPVEGDTPLPTRDSELGSPLLGPSGEVVVPEPFSTAGAGPTGEVVVPDAEGPDEAGGLEDAEDSRVPGHRLRDKTRLMAVGDMSNGSVQPPFYSFGTRD